MCMQGLIKFHPSLFKLLRKQNVTDGRMDGRTDGRTDNVKTVYPPTNIVCGGYNKGSNQTIRLICIFNVCIWHKKYFLMVWAKAMISLCILFHHIFKVSQLECVVVDHTNSM